MKVFLFVFFFVVFAAHRVVALYVQSEKTIQNVKKKPQHNSNNLNKNLNYKKYC